MPSQTVFPFSLRSTAKSLLLAFGLCWAGLSMAQATTSEATSLAPAADTNPAAETPGDNRQGTVKLVEGEVTLVHGDSRQAVVAGHAVHRGGQIITGDKSSVSITLRDGSVLSLGPNSAIELSQFDFDATTHEGNMLVALRHGSLRVITGLIAKLRPEQVKVTTPTTVVGVRGTDFIVEQKP